MPTARSNDRSSARDVILIGASVGGVEAIGQLLSELPARFDASIAVTLHRGPGNHSVLRDIFAQRCALPVIEPQCAQMFAAGNVYLAPADHHLVFGSGLVMRSHAAKVNHSRPSIDVMFRSGAKFYGPRVVGVILTGNLSDGVAGLVAITQRGGLSIAQEPAEAFAPSMPRSAVAFDDVAIVFRLAAVGEVLAKLVAGKGVSSALETRGTRRPHEALLAPGA